MTRLAAAIEAVLVWVGRIGVSPLLTWIAARFGRTVFLLPVAKTAYIGFIFTVLVAVWVKLRGEKLSDFGLAWPKKWLRAIAWGVALFAVTLVWALTGDQMLRAVLTPVFGPDRAVDTFAEVRGNLQLYLVVVPCIWVFAAIGEEFLYRGFIMTRLVQAFGDTRIGVTLAIVGQAIMFGLAHMYQGWVGVIIVSVGGIVTGVAVRLYKGNLVPAIIAHGLIDTLGFTLLYLGLM